MKLPREVRDSIWDYSTEGPIHYKMPKRAMFCRNCQYDHPARNTQTTCKQPSTPYEEEYPIFFVSRQIRRESLKTFYKSPFALELGDICPKYSPYPFHPAQQCMRRDTIPFKTLYTSATIHVNTLQLLDNHDFAGFQKLRQVTIDLGNINLLCTCDDGGLCARKETITLPEILAEMSRALSLFTMTPTWAPSCVTRNLYEHWKMRGFQINVKAKILTCEEGHERRLVSHLSS